MQRAQQVAARTACTADHSAHLCLEQRHSLEAGGCHARMAVQLQGQGAEGAGVRGQRVGWVAGLMAAQLSS